MFHMKHCTPSEHRRAAAKHPNVSCETFPHPYILCRADKPPQAARKARKVPQYTRRIPAKLSLCRPAGTPAAIDGIGDSRRREMRAPPRGSFGSAETPVRALAAKRQTGAVNLRRRGQFPRHRISIYNNEENRVNFARKLRENPPLPTGFARRFFAVKHARETYGRRADFRVIGPGKSRRLCRKPPPKTAFSARRRKKFFARKKVRFRPAYI